MGEAILTEGKVRMPMVPEDRPPPDADAETEDPATIAVDDRPNSGAEGEAADAAADEPIAEAEHQPTAAARDATAALEEYNRRFIQGVTYLNEWAKHVITLGSALMVLSVALLKDLAKSVQAPFSFVIAGLLGLCFFFMLLAIWRALGCVRLAASYVLTSQPLLGSGDNLSQLQDSVKKVKWCFFVSLVLFSLLAVLVLLAWALGWTSPPLP
jgi:hypothetical protein